MYTPQKSILQNMFIQSSHQKKKHETELKGEEMKLRTESEKKKKKK